MAFRRSKDSAVEKQRWRTFVRAQTRALNDSGIPERVYREKSDFDHWLMHGCHPADPARFTVEQMSAEARTALVHLVAAYLDEGFKDPGIAILSAEEMRRASAMTRTGGHHG